jgi:hypothetical protein
LAHCAASEQLGAGSTSRGDHHECGGRESVALPHHEIIIRDVDDETKVAGSSDKR